MSFSCPYFQFEDESCRRLRVDCVPGRPGCVLQKTSVFLVPVEERLRERERERAGRQGGTDRR
jgi:hypothetical protein